jgi:hypothetical protein
MLLLASQQQLYLQNTLLNLEFFDHACSKPNESNRSIHVFLQSSPSPQSLVFELQKNKVMHLSIHVAHNHHGHY